MTSTQLFKRKRTGKTNYKKRLELLKSRKPRLVIRKSNKYLLAQIVEYSPQGDRVLCGVTSKELLKLGWSYSGKNIPACYLTGKLLAGKAKLSDQEMILDLGLQTPVKGARLYSFVKGAVDSGMKILLSEEIFPKENRINGEHIIKHYSLNKKLFTKSKDVDKLDKIFMQISEKLDKNGKK